AVTERDGAGLRRPAARGVQADDDGACERGAQLREHELGAVLEQEPDVEGAPRVAPGEEEVRVAARESEAVPVGESRVLEEEEGAVGVRGGPLAEDVAERVHAAEPIRSDGPARGERRRPPRV